MGKSNRIAIINIGQLLTMSTEYAPNLTDSSLLGIIPNAGLLLENGKITKILKKPEYDLDKLQVIDAQQAVVMPGIVECHTHTVYAGDRSKEFELRSQGAKYEDILDRGGGILHTVQQTRTTPLDTLLATTLARLNKFAQFGVTTVEIKSGYGLELNTEVKMLQAALHAGKRHPLDVVTTFLGAHVIPDEYKTNRQRYVKIILEEMLPQVANNRLAEFCDVFCERSAFTAAESEAILTRAKNLGLKLKIHAEQLSLSGGAAVAAKLGAVSADHLDKTTSRHARQMGKTGVTGVLLPTATLYLGKTQFPKGNVLWKNGLPLAISTDYNPGSSPTQNIWLAAGLACTHCKLTVSQALWAITRGAAKALDRENIIGSIEVGKQADLLVLQVADYTQILARLGENPVRQVIKKGKPLLDEQGLGQ